jgi:ribonucleoside-triphosphate reductase
MELSKLLSNFSPSFVKIYQETPETLLDIEGIAPKHLDISLMSDNYFNHRVIDMSIDDNANVGEFKSYGNYLTEISKGWVKLQGYHEFFKTLEKLYGSTRACTLIKSIWSGNYYLHDSTSLLVPYCWAYSTTSIMLEGCRWGQLHSLPPHWRKSFMDQVKEVTIELAQEVAGAVAIGDLFVNYTYFVKKEGLSTSNPAHKKEIENDFQSLIHTLNKKLRPSCQSPFTNLSIFDRPNLEQLFGELKYPDGACPDFDMVEEIQKIFCEWFCKGDPNTGLPYRFPIVTLNIRIDKNRKILDKKSFDYFSRINLEKGCFNIYIASGNKIASCCRLINDLDLSGVDSFGNGGISLGSHRVITLNLARLGHIAKKPENIKPILSQWLIDARDLLIAHRQLLKDKISCGFLRFFPLGLISMERLFSTIGINGIYECLEELNYDVFSQKGRNFVNSLMLDIKTFASITSRETKTPFNIEQVPGESLAIKLAEKDKFVYQMPYTMYSNQFVPLWVDCDIIERIKLDGEFSQTLTGGGISHLNIGEKLTHPNQMKKLIEYAIRCGCEHFAVNYNFCKCTQGHITVSGIIPNCPICKAQIVDHVTRIVGYFVPVSAWNRGRQQEHKVRVFKKELFIPTKVLTHEKYLIQ